MSDAAIVQSRTRDAWLTSIHGGSSEIVGCVQLRCRICASHYMAPSMGYDSELMWLGYIGLESSLHPEQADFTRTAGFSS
jgi:hypothetical protein